MEKLNGDLMESSLLLKKAGGVEDGSVADRDSTTFGMDKDEQNGTKMTTEKAREGGDGSWSQFIALCVMFVELCVAAPSTCPLGEANSWWQLCVRDNLNQQNVSVVRMSRSGGKGVQPFRREKHAAFICGLSVNKDI